MRSLMLATLVTIATFGMAGGGSLQASVPGVAPAATPLPKTESTQLPRPSAAFETCRAAALAELHAGGWSDAADWAAKKEKLLSEAALARRCPGALQRVGRARP